MADKTDKEKADDLLEFAHREFSSIIPKGRYPEMAATIALGFYMKAVLEKLNGDFLTAPINSYGEGIGDAIQGQIVRGMAVISQYDHK